VLEALEGIRSKAEVLSAAIDVSSSPPQ